MASLRCTAYRIRKASANNAVKARETEMIEKIGSIVLSTILIRSRVHFFYWKINYGKWIVETHAWCLYERAFHVCMYKHARLCCVANLKSFSWKKRENCWEEFGSFCRRWVHELGHSALKIYFNGTRMLLSGTVVGKPSLRACFLIPFLLFASKLCSLSTKNFPTF